MYSPYRYISHVTPLFKTLQRFPFVFTINPDFTNCACSDVSFLLQIYLFTLLLEIYSCVKFYFLVLCKLHAFCYSRTLHKLSLLAVIFFPLSIISTYSFNLKFSKLLDASRQNSKVQNYYSINNSYIFLSE